MGLCNIDTFLFLYSLHYLYFVTVIEKQTQDLYKPYALIIYNHRCHLYILLKLVIKMMKITKFFWKNNANWTLLLS